jgi:hypothetical protein
MTIQNLLNLDVRPIVRGDGRGGGGGGDDGGNEYHHYTIMYG